MGRQSKKQSTPATELLNFHFSTPASSQSSSSSNNHNNNGNRNNRRKQQQYQRTAQDRASARRKANSAMFFLHSSADHVFFLTRRSSSKVKSESYSFSGSDEPVSWDSVRMVKQLVPLHVGRPEEQPACPICLCDCVCARITKCGHTFCLPCIFRHVQSYAESNPYDHVKCPCCGIPIIVDDLRLLIMETMVAPAVHLRIKLVKLHRQKYCPAPYLPLSDAPKHSNPHTAPCMGDPDAKYSRFNYVDPALYHSSMVANQEELEQQLKSTSANSVESVFLRMALDIVKKCLHQAQDELEEEQALQERFASPISGMYQAQSSGLVPRDLQSGGPNRNTSQTSKPISSSESAVQPVSHRLRGDSISSQLSVETTREAEDRSILNEATSSQNPPPEARRYRGDSIGSYKSVNSSSSKSCRGDETYSPKSKNITKPRCQIPGSMYLDESETVNFYQAEDGQLVFMNGFNMACLLSDFSRAVSADGVDIVSPPLPDYIEGNIVELENVHLTPEVRKRMPFLSHLPFYTDLVFVELDLNHVLSEATKKKFKEDLAKRRKRRQSKVQAEKRVDRAAKKEEDERINERKARVQVIDSEDDFFRAFVQPEPQLNAEDFGPAVGRTNQDNPPQERGSDMEAVPVVSFSQACQISNNTLESSTSEAFPALGSSPPNRSIRTGVNNNWGSRPPQQLGEDNPTDGPGGQNGPSGSKNKKRKGKGQKLLLFSTGGQRGSVH